MKNSFYRTFASSLWCLGNTYRYLGGHYAAYDHLKEAYRLYNALLPGNRELQRHCCQCGIDMVNEARLTFEDDDEVASLASAVEKQAATVSDDDIHVRSLIMLGKVLVNFGDRQEALRHLERAKLIVGSDFEALFWIAYVHYCEKRLPEALDAAMEAWKLSEPDGNLVGQAQNSFFLGTILFSANRV